jgi:type VI protein secretion system component Hcp
MASVLALVAFGSAPALSKQSKPNFNTVKGESMDDKHKDMMQSGSNRCDAHHAQPMNGIASDPEEGGQIAAKKANVGEIKVTKPVDTASTKMMQSGASATGCSPGQH